MTIVSACTQDNDYQPTESPMGEVSISLSTEGYAPQSKSTIEVGVPQPEELTVEIFKITDLGKIRLYKDTYENTKDKSIKLNCADYKLVAFYGDSLATGEDKAYYEGMTTFSLVPENRQQDVQATAKVANVRVAVEYGDNLLYDYTEYYSVIRSVTPGGRKKSVEFYQDETGKKAFVPYGTLHYELYAKIDGQWKYFPAEPVQPEKGDDITFKVDTKKLDGQSGINVTVAQTENKEYSYDIPSTALPQDAPKINTEMPSEIQLVEGDPARSDLRMNLVAGGNIKECWLEIDSEYLAAEGVPEKIDLAAETIEPHIKAALERCGVKWMKSMAGNRFAYIDFSGITKFISENVCNPDNLFEAEFSVEIIDQRHNPGQSSHNGIYKSSKYSFVQGVPVPSVSVNGFENGSIKVLEGTGQTAQGIKASVTAKGRIGHCYLAIDSPYLLAQGIPARVDLSSIDAATAQKIKEVGVNWPSDIASKTYAEIDFSGLVAYMDKNMYSAAKGQAFAGFSLTVNNEVTLDPAANVAQTQVGNFEYDLPEATISTIQDYNVWAKKIYDFSVNLTKGNPQQVKLQYSTGNGLWTDITSNTTLDGSVLKCAKLKTSPATQYSIRAIYHNNPDLWIGFNQVTTESETQIPNSDFETWTMQKFSFRTYIVGKGTKYRDWYLPYSNAADAWWAVNSKRTMPSETNGETALEKVLTYKVFPTVSYSVNNVYQGAKSAQIMTIAIGKNSTGSSLAGGDSRVVAGELFIGTADDQGNHSTDGRSFHSRPSKLTFKYQYKSIDNEQFLAHVKISLGNKSLTKEFYGNHSDSWATATIDLNGAGDYEVAGTPKATGIYISFKSTSSDDPEYQLSKSEEVAGTTYKLHRGSVLRIDDLKLIYE